MKTQQTHIALLLTSLIAVTAVVHAEEPAAPLKDWSVPVPGWKPVEPGEHPRLLFRKSDVPALRARMKTPEGAKMLERLRATLGGGEQMPTIYNKSKRAYDPNPVLPEGAFTISHMAGYGMLYQLTGDKKYAELGRQCFLKGKEGLRDRDNRYAQEGCDGKLRLGPSLAMIALGYDLCYDGWDEAFRREVALYLQNYESPIRTAKEDQDPTQGKGKLSLRQLVTEPGHGPSSNHHGAIIAGAGITVLAILGDPGTDSALLRDWDARCRVHLTQGVPQGFGPYGFYAEGQGASQVAVNAALLPYVQALRVAAGRDYVTGSTMVQWWTLRWVMELIADKEGRAFYPVRHELVGTSYGSEWLLANRGGMTQGGWFSLGFGALPEKYQPALLWTYQTFAAKDDEGLLDTKNYPHRAIAAMVNWPANVKPANPSTVMPKAIYDSLHGYYVIRNRWQDADDVVITMFAKTGAYRQKKAWQKRPTKVYGVGEKVAMGAINGRHDFMETAADGSTSIHWPDAKYPAWFAVDFSRRAGVDAVIVTSLGVEQDANSYRTLARRISIGEKGPSFTCLTLTTGVTHPAIKYGTVNGQPAAIIGGLAVTMEADKLVFHNAPSEKPGLGDKPVAAQDLKKLFVPPTVDEKDVTLPRDPCFAVGFDKRFEVDGVVFTPDLAGGKTPVQLQDAGVVPGVLGDGIQFGKGFGLVPSATPGLDLSGTNGFTVTCWVMTPEATPSSTLFLERGMAGHSGFYNFGFRRGIQFQSAIGDLVVPFDIVPDRWYHLACVMDPRDKSLALWVDGQFAGRTPVAGLLGQTDVYLAVGGRLYDEENPVGAAQWAGSLDEIRFFRRSLTGGEVIGLYREGAEAIRLRDEGGNSPPSPSIACDKVNGLPPLTVVFDASRSSDADKDVLTAEWDFGNGTKATGLVVTNTYPKLGRYTAALTLKDGRGGVARSEKGIHVKNEAPVVRAYCGWASRLKKKQVVGPDQILLDASESVDPEGQPLKLTWTVAGKTYEGAVAIVTLPQPGMNPVTLVADDGTGRKTTWHTTVNRLDADGRCLAEKPEEVTTPGLHYRYFHHMGSGPGMFIETHVPYHIEMNRLKKTGAASVPLPWNIRQRPVHYAVDWAGYITVPADGDYTFHYNVKGGAYLWLGTQLVGAWYQGFGSVRQTEFKDFTVKLQRGTHRFRCMYSAQKYSNQGLSIEWSGPGIEKQPISPLVFSRSLTVSEQTDAGIASPRVGRDVLDWFPVSNTPLDGLPPTPPAARGKLELTVTGPVADGYATFAVKAPAEFEAPVEYRWQLGDGTSAEGPTAASRYPPGNYTVTVRAQDKAGRSLTAFRVVRVPASASVECIGLRLARPEDLWRPSAVAGVVPQGYWHTLGEGYGPEEIRDNHGRKTGVTVVGGKQLPWEAAVKVASQSADDQLVSGPGLMDSRVIEITGIPYAKYDLILISPGAADGGVLAEYTFQVGAQTQTIRTARAPHDYAGRLIEETSANPDGNYIVFRGLTGPAQKIEVQSVKGGKRAILSAIQIIKSTEPK